MKYQQDLVWGRGYLPAYMTRFGLLLLGWFAFEWIRARLNSSFIRYTLNIFLVSCLVALSLLSHQGNRNIVDYKNQAQYLRSIAEQACNAGLLSSVTKNCNIVLGNIWFDYPSFTRDKIFSELCNTKVTTFTVPEYKALKESAESAVPAADQDVYYFHFEKFLGQSGFSFSGKLDVSGMDITGTTGFFATDFKLFYTGDECDTVNIAVKEGETFKLRSFSLIPIGYGTYIAIVPGLVDLNTIELNRNVKTNIWRYVE